MKTADDWLDEGDGLLEEGDLDGYLRCRREALRLEPGVPGVWIGTADALKDADRPDDAVRMLEAGIAANPEDWELRYCLADLLGDLDRPAEALPHFEVACLLAPQDYPSAYLRAVTLCQLERDEEGLACFDVAIRIDPRRAMAYYRKGMLLDVMGREAEAVAAFSLYLAVAYLPAYEKTSSFVMGYVQKMDPGKKLRTPVPGWAAQVQNHHTIVRLALGDFEEEEYPKCIVACMAVLEQDPNHAAAMAIKALALRKVDPPELEESDELLQRAFRIDPENAYVQRAVEEVNAESEE